MRQPDGANGICARVLLLIAALTTLTACRDDTPPAPGEVASWPWPEIVAAARGSEVTWRMWRGDPAINTYVENWVAPRLEERYDLRLRVVDGRGPEVVNQLVVEREAGARGRADLVWINGETFHNLRQEGLLWGPWAERIPAAAYVDSASAIVMRDFEQDPEGFESPWGRVQFALIYDEARTPDPPGTVAELAQWIDEHPGRFSHDQSFTGVTFLKILMYALSGGVEAFEGGFDDVAYLRGRDRTLEWLEARRDSFWRGGRAYPGGVAELHRLFANGEVDFTMSNNHNEVTTKVRQGLFPETARPLLLREGTIANAHYLGIPFNAPNPQGAMVVADFLLSPEAQLEKAEPGVWGDGTVLDPARLPEPWRRRFQALEQDPRALPADSLQRYALPEVAPEYHERLAEDWRRRIRPVGR
jgi:putative spermidine/putrescine transport system substrate-binding protein